MRTLITQLCSRFWEVLRGSVTVCGLGNVATNGFSFLRSAPESGCGGLALGRSPLVVWSGFLADG